MTIFMQAGSKVNIWMRQLKPRSVRPPATISEISVPRVRLNKAMLKRISASIYESRTLVTLRDALLPELLSSKLQVEGSARFLGSGD
ncbi:MAG: hypothetical protein FJX54_13520 [Alphaproteobacteria bacterium]|nr:hypothetical protein [Alphaproteobacteria bacterium]